jgi:hypothetical protein
MRSASTAVQGWLYPLLAAAVIYFYWFPRLHSGFWIDEAGTYWIGHGGLTHVWENLQIYPGQSIIYMHLSSLFVTSGGLKEVALRIPSVAAVLIAARLLFVFTERIIGSGSGYLAVLPFLSAGAIVESATNARPYALGLAVILASFLSLREWVHTGSTRQYWIYCLTSSAVVYLHYLFGLVFVPQAIYLLAAHRARRPISWGRVLGAAAFIGAVAIPLVRQVLTVARMAGSWTALRPPGVVSFLLLYPTQTITVVGIALVLYGLLYPKWLKNPAWMEQDDTVLLLTWLLLGPIVVFATARLTGYALFTQRYLIYALLPAFVLIAWALRHVNNERARFAVLAALSLNAFVYVFTLGEPDWRTPLEQAQKLVSPDTPLLLQSGFVESSKLDLSGEPNNSSYLFAPLSAYSLPNQVIPVPYALTPASERLVTQQVEQEALRHRRFALLTGDGTNVEKVLGSWFRDRGYTLSVQHIAGFTLVLYERSSTSPPAI